MTRIVLVPVDGSSDARGAIEFAADWAKSHDAELHLFHAPDLPSASELAFVDRYGVDVSKSTKHLEMVGQDIVAEAQDVARSLGVENVSGSVSIGNPAQQIVDKAEALSAELIVIGTRGMSDWKSLLVGSVSHKVMQMAPCTTVIVR